MQTMGEENLTALQIYEPISLRRHGKKAPTYVNWGMSGDCKPKRKGNVINTAVELLKLFHMGVEVSKFKAVYVYTKIEQLSKRIL